MASNPAIDNTGAVAIEPARVNIFARPGAGQNERPSEPQPSHVFEEGAACARDADPGHRAVVGRDRLGERANLGRFARVVALTALAAVVVALALQLAATETAPSTSRDRRESEASHPQERRTRAGKTIHPPVARRPAKGDHGPRHRRKVPGARSEPHPRPVPVNPPPVAPRPVPRRLYQPRRLPAPVPPGAPPEFM